MLPPMLDLLYLKPSSIVITVLFFTTQCLSNLYDYSGCGNVPNLRNCSYNSYLKISLRSDEIHIICMAPVPQIDPIRDIHSNGITDHSSIIEMNTNDSLLLNLVTIVRECENTKAKQIKYEIDLNKVQIIRITRNLLGENNCLEYFNIEITDENQDLKNITVFDDDFLKYGTNLKDLVINNAKIKILFWQYFKCMFEIETINLASNQIEVLEQAVFQNLPNLRFVSLRNNFVKDLNHNLEMLNLTHIDISLNSIENLRQNTFYKTENLKFLNLSNAGLKSIEFKTFDKFSELETLDLSYNANLTFDENIIVNLASLKSLNISLLRLTHVPMKFLYRAKNLEVFNISTNLLTYLENKTFYNLTKLRIIDLSWNKLKTLSMTLLDTLDNLAKLDISGNQIKTINLVKEMLQKKLHLFIDLTDNQVEEINLIDPNTMTNYSMSDYRDAETNWTIFIRLSDNKLMCDCRNLQTKKVPKTKKHKTFIRLSHWGGVCYVKRYPCPLIYISNCPPECNCFTFDRGEEIYVNCSSRGLKKFPEIHNIKVYSFKNLRSQVIVDLSNNSLNIYGQELLKNCGYISVLDLSNNNIKNLQYLPPNVKELRLDNNSLSLLSEDILNQLEKSETIEDISLKNNPWECNCDALLFQKYLIKYNNIKVNQSTVLCKGTFDQLVYTKICEAQKILKIALPVVFAIAALLALTMALYYKYSMEIKIYLYSKNMCLWFAAEEDLDKHKIYDIFVSFHHKDSNFVANNLLPGLEPRYKICIHSRDFTPGAFISDQIVNSIQDSRRTLVILTENFLESTWGMMEFRIAHAQAEQEKRTRVIIVLPNGLLSENLLDDDLKAYLKTNTYVEWGDTWFWKKLKHALPHSKLKTNNRARRSIGYSAESLNLR